MNGDGKAATPVAIDSISKLSTKLGGAEWPNIEKARREAEAARTRIGDLLAKHGMVQPDTSFVVFGSLARDEWTINSDVDWTLLIDGQAIPEHLKVSQRISGRLKEAKLAEPGPTGTFGQMAFSHDLIHNIGGEDDTNANTTRRVLLLLESRAVGDAECYRRVIGQILNRYLDDDISFISPSAGKYKIPRFLLNDIVRYWRTMCVDYASKHRERQGQGWALRNAKLRLSRKLIFVSGLLTCYGCYLEEPTGASTLFEDPNPDSLAPLLGHLTRFVDRTPLEIVAESLERYARPSTATNLMNAYDRFLELLNDGEARDRLRQLKSYEARGDKVFGRVREISNEFQSALTSLFFDDHPKLADLTRKYGIF